MLAASFVGAFLGGVLLLLAPCSALLLPAFCAYALASRSQLVKRTLVFLAGVCTVFVPFGLGLSVAATVLIEYRPIAVVLAGLLLIVFGSIQLAGGSFGLVPSALVMRLPGGMRARVPTASTSAGVYSLGLMYGVGGFCSGPLLGGVLSLAMAPGNVLLGAALLITFCVGIVAPLLVLASVWDRLEVGTRRWFRGRAITLGAWQLHSSAALGGVLFIALGTSFIVLQGSSGLSGVYDAAGLSSLGYRLEAWIAASQ